MAKTLHDILGELRVIHVDARVVESASITESHKQDAAEIAEMALRLVCVAEALHRAEMHGESV